MSVQVLQLVLVLLLSFSSSRVGAFSNGVGSCREGVLSINNDAAGNAHVTSMSGPLLDAGVTFTVNGVVFRPDIAISVPVGTDLVWSVDATVDAYKGILIRAEAAGDYTHVGDPTFVDEAALCVGLPDVQGLDHFSNELKTSVTGTTNFDLVGFAVIDVVVVFSLAQWAHSTFVLSIEDGIVTPAPVEGTTPAPVSDVTDQPTPPISAPVAIPAPIVVAPKKGMMKDGGMKKDEKEKGVGKKDGKETKVPKAPKVPKEEKAPKGTKAPKEEKAPKATKAPKEEKEPKGTKTPKETKEPKEAKEKSGKTMGKGNDDTGDDDSDEENANDDNDEISDDESNSMESSSSLGSDAPSLTPAFYL